MKYKVRTPYNYNHAETKNELHNTPSETIPGEAYTVRELLEKFTNGVMPANIHRQGTYDEHADIDNPDVFRNPDLDLSDIDEAENFVLDTEDMAQAQIEALQTTKEDEAEHSEAPPEKVQGEAPNEAGADPSK